MNKLQGKDLINVGIFTAIYFVVMMAIAMLGFIPIFLPLLIVLVPLIGGIVSTSGIRSRTTSQSFFMRFVSFHCVQQHLLRPVHRYARPAFGFPEQRRNLLAGQFAEGFQGEHLAIRFRQTVESLMRTQGETVFRDHLREIRDGRLRHVVQWQRRLLPHDAQKLIPCNRAEPCADRTFSFVPLPIFHRLIECFLRDACI